jgi:TP901 family phage tail tape measure protein
LSASDRALRLQVLLSALDKASGPMRAVLKSSRGLAGAVKDARDRLRELEQQNKRLDAFRKTARDVALTGNAMQSAQGKVRELANAIAATDAPSKAMVRNLDAAKREAGQLKVRHQALTQQQQRLRTELHAAGVPLQGMARHQAELRKRIDEATGALHRQQAALKKEGARLSQVAAARAKYQAAIYTRNQIAGAGASATVAGAAIGAPVIAAVRDYSSFEDAMLGIQRQVQGVGDIGSASYKAIATEVKQLSRELPLTTNEIADMYTAAARMDVPREGLRAFVKDVAMMATAFDAVPAEIAESLGKVAANFKIPLTDIGRLADTINYLDDNAISKAGDIIDVLNRAAGVAGSVRITDKAVAALASTLLTLGAGPEVAGTAISAMLTKFSAAESGSKTFKTAMTSIGLSLSDVQNGMQSDAQGTLFKIVEAINRLPANQRPGAIVGLVGLEHVKTLSKLVTNTEEWRRQISLANNAAAKGSMQREFAKRMQAMSSAWQLFKNSFFDANTESGSALRGALLGTMKTMTGLFSGVADFMRAHPALTAGIVKTVAVVALLVGVFGAAAIALAALIGPFAMWSLGLTFMVPALGAVAAGIGTVVAVLLANPIGLAITGIAAAALLVWKYWLPIKTFFAGLPAQLSEWGRMAARGFVDGLIGAWTAAKTAVMGAADAVTGWFKEKLGIRSPSRVFAGLGSQTMAGLALGLSRGAPAALGVVARTARGLTLAAGIGAAGLATAGGIDTRPPLSAPGGGAGQGGSGNSYSITIHAAPGMDEQALARAVTAELARRDRATAARSRSRLADRD